MLFTAGKYTKIKKKARVFYVFTDVSRECLIPVRNFAVNSILKSLPRNHFKDLSPTLMIKVGTPLEFKATTETQI